MYNSQLWSEYRAPSNAELHRQRNRLLADEHDLLKDVCNWVTPKLLPYPRNMVLLLTIPVTTGLLQIYVFSVKC